MPIYAPDKRINPTIRRREKSRKPVYASLFLTSMVDMFAILVIFLLQSFSSEGEIIVLPSGIQLPEASNTGVLERAPSIVIGMEEIMFEGEVIAQTNDLRGREDWALQPLQEALQNYKKDLEAQAIINRELEEEDEEDRQKINISADRRLEFEIVKKVIYNAGFEGFPDFRFAVFPGPKSTDNSAEPESEDG